MSGGGTKTQTTTQNTKTDPWAPAQPALQQILSGAGAAYSANPTAKVYQGDRTAGLGSDTLVGLNAMKDGAASGAGTASAGNGFVGGLLGNGGATAGTSAATAGLARINPSVATSGVSSAVSRLTDPGNVATATGRRLADGSYDVDTAPLAGLASGMLGGTSQTERSLQDVADGKFLGGANPYLDDIISRSANEAASTVGQKFAASGRYGSGRFSGAVADAVSGIGTKLRYDDYEAERGRQANAATAIDAAGNARAGLASSLLSTASGIRGQNASVAATGANLAQGALTSGLAGEQVLASLKGDNANREISQASALLSGAQSDRAAGLGGIAALPTVQSALVQPGQIGAQVGAIQDAARQDDITADMGRFDEENNAAWAQLGKYAGLAFPAAGMGGTSSGTTIQKIPQPGLLQTLLGTGLAGASIASRFIPGANVVPSGSLFGGGGWGGG